MHPQSIIFNATCAWCGTPFHAYPSTLRSGFGIHCSNPCYYAHKRKQTVEGATARFWSKIEKTDGCWLWTESVNNSGYGTFYIGDGEKDGVHRFSWRLAHGPIPEGSEVCHSCDKDYPPGDIIYRRCVRPDHLFLGTRTENAVDMMVKGRGNPGHLIGESHGMAKLTNDDVISLRRRYAAGGVTFKGLAIEYGVTLATVRFAILRITWAHLP